MLAKALNQSRGAVYSFVTCNMRGGPDPVNVSPLGGLGGLGFNLPRGSYPTPFLGRLLFKITDPNHKTRYPKKGVGYEPLGTVWDIDRISGPQFFGFLVVRRGYMMGSIRGCLGLYWASLVLSLAAYFPILVR